MTRDYVTMQAVLRAYYVDQDVDSRILEAVLQRNPVLEAQSLFFDWDDTQMREDLLTAVCEVLGIEWTTNNLINQSTFEESHWKWVAAHA